MGQTSTLSDTPFVVVDIETTGSIPNRDAITELAAVKIVGGEIVDRFETLVNPQQDIPIFIQHLTGITPDMVQDAPLIQEIMPQFWEFLGDAVFVAHYVPFDFRFLSGVTQNLLGEPLTNPQLCTCRLARKLLPNLKRKNLDSVSAYFEIDIAHRHRAMGDAEATAQIFIHFLTMMAADQVQTLDQILAYQKSGSKRYASLNIPFPEHRLSDYPQNPGIYYMRNDKGDILYIGKAKNLRKRLKSYFSNLTRQADKVQELMQQVYDIDVRVLGSELEALLEEAYQIKQHQPYYNRQIKNYRSFPYIKLNPAEPYPNLTVTPDLVCDDALYFGPYHRKRYLLNLIESLSKIFQLRSCTDKDFQKHQRRGAPCIAYELKACSGPCADKVTPEEYQLQVRHMVDFLEGRVSDVTRHLITLRDAYSAELAYEKARSVQEKLMELLRFQANTRYLAKAVHQNHMLIILPDKKPSRNLILYIYKGRPVYKQVFDPETDDIETILERVRVLQKLLKANLDEKREVIPQAEVEELRIIAQWLRRDKPDDAAKILHLTEDYPKLANQIYKTFSLTPHLPPVYPRQTADLEF